MFNRWMPRPAITAIVIIAALLAQGCTSPMAAPSPTAAPPTAAPTAVPPPTATNTPFVPKATVKIVSESLDSVDISNGAQLAVDQLAGGLQGLGYAAVHVAYFDQEDVDAAVKNAKEFIADPEVLCGVGPYSSRVMVNVIDLYHNAQLAFISPSATNPQVTNRHYLEVNRVTGRDDVQGLAAVMFARSKSATTAYLVRTDFDFFNRVADAFKGEAAKTELHVAGDGRASGNNEALIGKIMATGPELVFFTGFPDQSGLFFKNLRAAGYTGILLAGESGPGLGEAVGPLALEGGNVYYLSGGTPAEVYPGTAKFADEYAQAFDRPPRAYAAEAYDAAGICLKAIEEAARAKGGELPTREEVAKAIRALQDYPGITGTYTFNEDGDPMLMNYYVMQLTQVDSNNWGKNPVAEIFTLPPPD